MINLSNKLSNFVMYKDLKKENTVVVKKCFTQIEKYKFIEQMIVSCAINNSNIKDEIITYELVYNRLMNLKLFIDQVIIDVDLNSLLHNFIDSILYNSNFKKLYEQTSK